MSPKRIHRKLKRRKRIGFDLCVPLRQYADENFLAESTLRYHIATYKIIAYWFRRRWWILPPEYYEQLGLYPESANPGKKASQNKNSEANLGAG